MMPMQEKIKSLLQEVEAFSANDKQGLETFRLRYVSRKGAVGDLFEELKQIPNEEKKIVGKILNELKQAAEAKLLVLSEQLEATASSNVDIDLTLPGIPNTTGNLHPLSLTRYRIIEIFERLGFNWPMDLRLKTIGTISLHLISLKITLQEKCRTHFSSRRKVDQIHKMYSSEHIPQTYRSG
jgi:phenylalanyl-tRNA synthetase alpha subunit